MVIPVVVTIPVAFVHMPAILVMIIVRVAPICASVWWTVPAPGNPYVPAAVVTPVSVDPGIAFTRHRRTAFITHRWRRLAADDDADLRRRRSCEGGSRNGGHGKRADK